MEKKISIDDLYNSLTKIPEDQMKEVLKKMPEDVLDRLIQHVSDKLAAEVSKETPVDLPGVYNPNEPKVLRPYTSRNERLGRAKSVSLGAAGLQMRERIHNKQMAELEEDPKTPTNGRGR